MLPSMTSIFSYTYTDVSLLIDTIFVCALIVWVHNLVKNPALMQSVDTSVNLIKKVKEGSGDDFPHLNKTQQGYIRDFVVVTSFIGPMLIVFGLAFFSVCPMVFGALMTFQSVKTHLNLKAKTKTKLS